VERAIAAGLPLRVQTAVEVEQFLLNGGGDARGVCVLDRTTGQRSILRARRYVLAAGALHSPVLLKRSGADEPLIGRHYMAHLGTLVVGVFPRRTRTEVEFVKQVGFADFYFGTKEYPHKMGLIQSLAVPGPLLTAKYAPRLVPRTMLRFLRQRMLPLVGLIEDLPNPDNCVTCGPDGRPQLRHRFGAYDRKRGRHLGRQIARILKRTGAVLRLGKLGVPGEHVAHQCGTIRFGRDPAHAVLDPDCRTFSHPNVFVVDGSFFPTSLGVGPALTIIANALRVAAIVTREV
jgi:choline dehydrogenase-like flavoprotein